MVKHPGQQGKGEIFYASTPPDWKRGQKYNQLDEWESAKGLSWKTLKPDSKSTWLLEGTESDFDSLLPLGNKADKGSDTQSIFSLFSLGIVTGRDSWLYSYQRSSVGSNVQAIEQAFREQQAGYLSAK